MVIGRKFKTHLNFREGGEPKRWIKICNGCQAAGSVLPKHKTSKKYCTAMHNAPTVN